MPAIKELIAESRPGETPVESQIRADAWERFRAGEKVHSGFDPVTNKEDHLANADEEGLDKLNYLHMHFMQLAEQDPELLELVKRDICTLENLEMEAVKMLRELREKEQKIIHRNPVDNRQDARGHVVSCAENSGFKKGDTNVSQGAGDQVPCKEVKGGD